MHGSGQSNNESDVICSRHRLVANGIILAFMEGRTMVKMDADANGIEWCSVRGQSTLICDYLEFDGQRDLLAPPAWR